MNKLIKLFTSNKIFFLILILGALIRFYRLPEMAHFDFDQEYASNFAYSVLKEYPIQLIGQGLSVQGLFMGPLYFYYLVPFFALTNLHPIGGSIGSVILGLFSIAVIYFILKNIFDSITALVYTFFRGFGFTYINGDWDMTPTHSSGVIILATWYCFYKLWHGKTNFIILLAFIMGLYTSIHPILFPFYLVFLVLLILRRKLLLTKKGLLNPKKILLSLAAFFIPFSPLVLFEIRHNFLEIKQLFSFYQTSNSNASGANHLEHYINAIFINPLDTIKLPFISVETTFFIVLVLTILLNLKGVGFWKDSFHKVMLFITFFVFIFYYSRFSNRVPEYYFQALFALLIVYVSACLSMLYHKKILGKVILGVFLINFLINNFNQLNTQWRNEYLKNLYHKDNVVKEIIRRQNTNEEFFVSYITHLGWNTGFNYLFKYYGKVPQTREAKDPIYTIVLPWDLSIHSIDYKSGNVGLILPEDRI